MKANLCWRPASLLVSSLALLASSVSGQPAAARAAQNDEKVELSPFEVRALDERGYVASETLTGTRVATQIKDLPYTVNVITSEFFEDFGMFQIDDTLTQIGGLTGVDIGGGFNLRGFTSSSQLRDGFYRLGRYGQTNIDRIEVIKGPNAGIYGRTSPGGMINMISKAPQRKNQAKLTARYGDFDTTQGSLEATGSLTPNTYYILTLSHFNRGADMDWFHIRENQGMLSVKHHFANGGRLLLSAEYFMQYRNAPMAAAPIVTDQKNTASTADDEAIGYAKNLARYNAYGPNSELERGSNTGLITYDRKLNGIFSMRLGGQIFQARRWDYNQNTGFGAVAINSTSATGSLRSTRGATPNRGLIFEDGGGVQADVVANYPLFKNVVNKTLVTVDFNDYYRYDPTRNSGAAAAIASWTAGTSGRVILLNPDYSPTAPLTYFTSSLDDGGQAALTRLTRRRTTVFGGQFRQESHWMQDRLLTYFGARFDSARFRERDYTATVNGVPSTLASPYTIDRTVKQTKPNVGALFKVRPNFRIYGNYSESYFVNQTDNPADIGSIYYKPETAKGYDFGFKGSFFEERLNYTIGGFYIERFNVSVSDSVETPPGSGSFVTVTRREGDQLDRGIEADVNWKISPNLSTGLSYGHVNAIYTDFGSAFPSAIGRDVQNISPTNGSVYLKFDGRTGRLKGFSANLGVTYVSATPTEAPNAGDAAAGANGIQPTTSTYQWKLRVPSYTLWNLGLSYNWGSKERFSHTVRLNLNNVLDRDYLKVNKTFGDPRGIYLSYTLGAAHSLLKF
ncbi:MAG TPA: TonB-dependent receptor [Opitutaceae bacterium]|nr:TonB-dependent receptor [Opitutaceae bacterium]